MNLLFLFDEKLSRLAIDVPLINNRQVSSQVSLGKSHKLYETMWRNWWTIHLQVHRSFTTSHRSNTEDKTITIKSHHVSPISYRRWASSPYDSLEHSEHFFPSVSFFLSWKLFSFLILSKHKQMVQIFSLVSFLRFSLFITRPKNFIAPVNDSRFQ